MHLCVNQDYRATSKACAPDHGEYCGTKYARGNARMRRGLKESASSHMLENLFRQILRVACCEFIWFKKAAVNVSRHQTAVSERTTYEYCLYSVPSPPFSKSMLKT